MVSDVVRGGTLLLPKVLSAKERDSLDGDEPWNVEFPSSVGGMGENILSEVLALFENVAGICGASLTFLSVLDCDLLLNRLFGSAPGLANWEVCTSASVCGCCLGPSDPSFGGE